MHPTPPGAFVTRFLPGPPLYVPTLGWLPGPPHSLVPLIGSTLYVIDDAHAGEVYSQGDKTVRLISTAQALSWMVSTTGAPATPPLVEQPVAPSARWLNKSAAAAALGVSAWTLEDVRKRAPSDLAGGPHPGGAGKKRIQWRYPAEPDTLTSWWKAATEAARQDGAPRRRCLPRPPRKPKTAKPSGRRRSVLALLKDEHG